MKTTTNHGFKKPDGTDIVNIEDLNYNADKLDGLLVAATTTTNGLMSKDDKTKLNGIAAGANNYTHPATHPASMISGLHKVATSGSYNDLTNKPSTFPPSNHSHDDRYYTESEINSKLDGKANTSHTHAEITTMVNRGYLNAKSMPVCDLNDIVESGCYAIKEGSSNMPYNNWGILEVTQGNVAGNHVVQTYTLKNIQQQKYYRVQSGTTWTAWKEIATVYDSGWLNLPLSTGISSVSGYTCQYRKYGNICMLRGILTGATLPLGSSNITVGTLPSGFRPTATLMFDGQKSTDDGNYCKFAITSAGSILLKGSNVSIVSSNGWLLSSCIFFTD